MTHSQVGLIDAEKLVTPIYVDTSALLDVLASLDNGFSFVEKVSSQTSRAAGTEAAVKADAGTEFGVPNVLSLLKIKLGASLSTKLDEQTGQQVETERYHTYGSLLFRLREVLVERSLLKRLDDNPLSWTALRLADFVELHGTLNPNPFAESLRGIDRFAHLFELYGNIATTLLSQQAKSGQGKQQGTASPQVDKSQMAQVKAVRTFAQGLLADIEKTDIRTIVIDLSGAPSRTAVASLFIDYLRDPSMTELAAKQYRVLGRMVGKLTTSDEAIDLLRGTGLSAVGDQALSQLADVLQVGNLAKPVTKVTGPALQIVPIAIYV